jgi:hypothetical protein
VNRIVRCLGIALVEFDEMTETLEDFELGSEDIARIGGELRRREPVIVAAR